MVVARHWSRWTARSTGGRRRTWTRHRRSQRCLTRTRGGRIDCGRPIRETLVRRRYVQHTNQLETMFTTPTGQLRLTDSLNSGSAGALPWSELARRVEGLDGEVDG